MIITFCGHRELYDEKEVKVWLERVTENLIVNGAEKFYLGGYGAFDRLAASVLAEQKKRYPQIELVLILPYLNRRKDISPCDSSLYPPLESVPRRYAILRRNEWMIQRCDVLVAYVTHGWGGAARTLAYARKKKKTILAYGE